MQIKVPALNELRIEKGTEPYTLKVLSGSLDIQGQELLNDHLYTFNDNLFFTTFISCVVEVSDNISLQYTTHSNIETIFDLAVKLQGT